MLLYVSITHPMESDFEDRIEECIQEWFQEQRLRWDLPGILPYDPILREIAIDVGNIPLQQVAESLRHWLTIKADLEDSDYLLSDHSSLGDHTPTERIEHFRHKLLYLLGSIRRLNHTLGSERLKQIEYLLGGIATEAVDLLPTHHSVAHDPPLEEGWSRQIDEFWRNL
jgi:hypothetical protein